MTFRQIKSAEKLLQGDGVAGEYNKGMLLKYRCRRNGDHEKKFFLGESNNGSRGICGAAA